MTGGEAYLTEGSLTEGGLLALFIVLLVKAAGVPVPIPADALLLATGVQVAAGKIGAGPALGTPLLALVLGGLIQYWLARGPARGALYRYGHYLGLPPTRLEAAAGTARRRGPVSIAVAMLLPGVRIVAVAACGLAGTPLRRFFPGLVVGSGVDTALHFLVGYAGGALLGPVLAAMPGPWLVAAVAGLLAIGLALWLAIRRRRQPSAAPAQVMGEAVAAWQQATCPLCLTLGSFSESWERMPSQPPAAQSGTPHSAP